MRHEMSTNKKVILIGVGFSCPGKLPLMKDFRSCLQKLYNDKYSGLGGHQDSKDKNKIDDRNFAEEVLKEWKKQGLNDDLEVFYGKISNKNADIQKKANYIVGRTLELAMNNGPSQKESSVWQHFYLPFAAEIGKRKNITTVSLNYDLLFDQALLQNNFCPAYHLPLSHIIEINDFQKPKTYIPLLKPHGSLNWLICSNPACKIIHVHWDSGPEKKKPGNWPTGWVPYKKHSCDEKDEYLQFILVPPVTDKGKKYINSNNQLLKSIDNKLEPVEKAYKEVLQEAESIFFLGWSAPESDEKFLKDLANNIGSNCRNVYVVNKVSDKEETQKLKNQYYNISKDRFNLNFFLGEESGDIQNFRNSLWWEKLIG